MRSGEEIRQAIAMLGASFVGSQMRHHVWEEGMNEERIRAWAMFQALGWVVGVEDSDLSLTLEYVALKMQEYVAKENEHATR